MAVWTVLQVLVVTFANVGTVVVTLDNSMASTHRTLRNVEAMLYFRETSILFFWICGYNTLNKFNEGNWVFADVQGEISLVTSFWRSSFERVWKLLAYSPGATWPAWSVNSPWAADWRSTSLVVSATEQGLKLANTHCVNSCIWDLKLLDCHTGNVVHFLVAFLRQVVDNTWEAVLAKNAAQE